MFAHIHVGVLDVLDALDTSHSFAASAYSPAGLVRMFNSPSLCPVMAHCCVFPQIRLSLHLCMIRSVSRTLNIAGLYLGLICG